MTQEKFIPDLEKVKQTSLKVKEVCQRADAGILILDDLIAELEQQIKTSSLYHNRLNKAKNLLNLDSAISRKKV